MPEDTTKLEVVTTVLEPTPMIMSLDKDIIAKQDEEKVLRLKGGYAGYVFSNAPL